MHFMDLRRPEYSHMFGFLQADGHLSAGTGQRGRLRLEVSARDRELLERFQRLCPYPSSIRERTRATNFSAEHASSIWTLCALEARNTLHALGMPYGRKSTLIGPPTGDHVARDYLRGLVDADGAIGVTAKGFPFLSLTTSSAAVSDYFCQFGLAVGGALRRPGRNARDGVFNILYTNDPAVAIARELYYEGSPALARKAAKAEIVRAWERPAGMRARSAPRRWTEVDDAVVRAHPADTAAVLLGRTVASCTMRRWRLAKAGEPVEPAPPQLALFS
ncbi:hypothetical protein EHYA_06639 [Embleya hyalina]|uniref:Homing endonuclease LAGLIDADG domain-containing protein n=2 Tax=Embleya hyalina TaxID=516124 RepID=A0A401YWD4_9ACTN|nr:hypothetical protein EHYA_06639 [Embleya hyalina]